MASDSWERRTWIQCPLTAHFPELEPGSLPEPSTGPSKKRLSPSSGLPSAHPPTLEPPPQAPRLALGAWPGQQQANMGLSEPEHQSGLRARGGARGLPGVGVGVGPGLCSRVAARPQAPALPSAGSSGGTSSLASGNSFQGTWLPRMPCDLGDGAQQGSEVPEIPGMPQVPSGSPALMAEHSVPGPCGPWTASPGSWGRSHALRMASACGEVEGHGGGRWVSCCRRGSEALSLSRVCSRTPRAHRQQQDRTGQRKRPHPAEAG